MMYKAGMVSYYGPSVMAEFGEYVKMAEYTKEAVEHILFSDCNFVNWEQYLLGLIYKDLNTR